MSSKELLYFLYYKSIQKKKTWRENTGLRLSSFFFLLEQMQRDLFRSTHLIIYRTCKRKTNYLKLHLTADCSDQHIWPRAGHRAAAELQEQPGHCRGCCTPAPSALLLTAQNLPSPPTLLFPWNILSKIQGLYGHLHTTARQNQTPKAPEVGRFSLCHTHGKTRQSQHSAPQN